MTYWKLGLWVMLLCAACTIGFGLLVRGTVREAIAIDKSFETFVAEATLVQKRVIYDDKHPLHETKARYLADVNVAATNSMYPNGKAYLTLCNIPKEVWDAWDVEQVRKVKVRMDSFEASLGLMYWISLED